MILVSLVAGLVAVVLAARWLAQQSSLSVQKVAVANIDLNVGHPIRADNIRLVDWPRGSVPQGAFADAAELEGRVTKINLLRDEPILEPKLAPKGTKGGLSAVIGEGKRAITVKVNEVVGVAGFALPGNYVDVMVNTREGAARGANTQDNISKIVLERILVLAIAQEASRDDTKPKVVNAVTLEVTPEQAEKLDLARSVGTLSLVLRNQLEAKPAQTAGATKETLLNLRPEPSRPTVVSAGPVRVSAPAPAVRRNCIDVITGVRRSHECF
jgi:pilus assembly protein CpaB